jgi:hypothetical protein
VRLLAAAAGCAQGTLQHQVQQLGRLIVAHAAVNCCQKLGDVTTCLLGDVTTCLLGDVTTCLLGDVTTCLLGDVTTCLLWRLLGCLSHGLVIGLLRHLCCCWLVMCTC